MQRLKTVEYWFPYKDTVADAVDTALDQITVYIPEAGSGVTFRTVVLDIVVEDKQTTSTNIGARAAKLTMQGATVSTQTNSNTLTQSGENIVYHMSFDYTSYFTSNWGTNTSRTLDLTLNLNTTATGSGNVSAKLVITYAFDDTASTHLKTVWIPLDADRNALSTTKTAADTIPALDTYLPEASKVYRQITLVTQGNQESALTTDTYRYFDIDSISQVSALYEKGLNTSSWYRLNQVYTFDTSTTHTYYSWCSQTDFDHPQAWLVVTYEFSPGSTTSMMNSLLLPMEFGGAMGGPASTDAQRGERHLWIQEDNPSLERCALLVFYDQMAAITATYARLGASSYGTAYSSVGTASGGGYGFMVRDDSAFTLARGKNILTCDIYNTDNTDLGFNLAGLWLVNYTSDVPSQGVWAANHTVIRNLKVVGTTAASAQSLVSATAPDIPETEFFITSVGVHYLYTTNTTGNAAGVHVGARNDTDTEWLNVYESQGGTDPEVGIRQAFATARSVFNRWYGDIGPDRVALQTARRWRLTSAAASFDHLDMYLTYHTITYTVAGTVSGSGGGTVDLDLERESTHEGVLSTSRSGNGAFSFTWYDDTEDVYVSAYEDGTHVGRSAPDTAV